ncbi:MAG TPA: hypothetical protein VJZ00_22755 [Thermoanaerobaculia bacterium]|nr:hypothetical protein [Thermoanaerobaculia bacterium]
MHRRLLSLIALLILVSALPVAASQFIDKPFDDIARESALIVRGTISQTWTAWDANHEVIYTYATVRVGRYFGEATGPDTLVVREAGGTVDGYTMEAIGFPMLRDGQDVVLMLAKWDDGADYRIHAFNQGKFLVRNRGGVEVLVSDTETQGSARLDRGAHGSPRVESIDDGAPGLRLDEFASMVDAARGGETGPVRDTKSID